MAGSPAIYPTSSFEDSMAALVSGLGEKREEFEDQGEAAVRARLRAQVGERTSKREVVRFLALMRERGNGSIGVAWRRYFDSDGDGELDFREFCQALVEFNYEGDVLRLWHDLASKESPNALGLGDLDTKGALALDFFGQWCADKFGGPAEFFKVIDDCGSDSLTVDEFTEGLDRLGFFSAKGIPDLLKTQEKVLNNLYPLLDSHGTGACSCEQLMFLEKDKDKMKRHLRELERIREYGKDVGGHEPLKSKAHNLLHRLALSTTPLGGNHWATVTDEVAVGEPMSPTSPGGRSRKSMVQSPSNGGRMKQDARYLFSSPKKRA